MKRLFQIVLFFALIASASVPLNASPLEEVKHSRHNLLAPSNAGSNACTVCHIDAVPGQTASPNKEGAAGGAASPESAAAAPKREPAAPLWGSGRSKPYNLTAALSADEQPYNHPTGSSLTCLACHDGAVGTDMHGINVDQPRRGAEGTIPWNGSVGRREAPPLSRVDHPISIPYPRNPNGRFVGETPGVTLARYWALPDRHEGGWTLPTSATSSYLDLPEEKVSSPEVLSNLVRTTSGMVQCDSCHNPHSEQIRPFLRVPPSNLCLVCHDR